MKAHKIKLFTLKYLSNYFKKKTKKSNIIKLALKNNIYDHWLIVVGHKHTHQPTKKN